MKSQIYKRLVLVAMLFSLVFVVTNATAKKRVKPPPEPDDDPCLTMESFSPDYAFYRVTGKRKNQKFTIFLAESDNGCEKALVEFPRLVDGNYLDIRDLKFSSIVESDVTFGRVVWLSKIIGVSSIVWSYDFSISGTNVSSINGLREILISGDYWNQKIYHIDLAPDTATLTYQLVLKDPDTEEYEFSVRMIDIGYCDGFPSACSFDNDRALVFASIGPTSDLSKAVSAPTWGPLGKRIYFLYDQDDYKILKFIDLDDDWKTESWPPEFTLNDLYSSENHSEFHRMRRLASGIMGDAENKAEYLAVEFPHELINCGYIYFINVKDCERVDNPVCFTDLEFAGTNPSWTRDGKVIHNYLAPKQKACWVYGWAVGLYDGSNPEELHKGYRPNAAGGLPE